MNPIRDAGFWIRTLAVLHAAVGIAAFHPTLVDIAREGVFNTVNGQLAREVAFWFLIFAPMLYLFGTLATQARREHGAYPPLLIWTLLLICLFGTVIMPASGFPAGLLVCAQALRHTRTVRTSSATQASM